MASWRDVAAGAPELAAAAERIFRSFTLAYLATVRADGGPRVHPVTITLHGGELWVFLVRGTPKRRDLLRDPRYALHSFPVLRDGSYASYVDEEVDRLYRELLAAGGSPHKEPWDAFWGQRYAQLEDPDGTVVDLFAPLPQQQS